jgi:hypothetical protein
MKYNTNFRVPEYKYRVTRIPGVSNTPATVSYQCAKKNKHLGQCPKMNCTCECHVTGKAPAKGEPES